MTVRAGELSRETVLLLPIVAPPAPREQRARLLRTLSYAGYALGGALLIGGVAANVVREQQAALYNDDSRCLVGFALRDETCGGERVSAELAQGLAITGYVTGGALIAASTGLLIYSLRREKRLACAPSGPLGLFCSF